MYQIKESDWKLFRSRLPGWQESYMERLNREYAALLAGSEHPSIKFWNLEERINEDKKHVGVSARMSRSNMLQNIYALLEEGAITMDDLEDFSDELQELMAAWMKNS